MSRRPRPTLNEGRGLDPGNTTAPRTTSSAAPAAQRRPGPRPRQHTMRVVVVSHGPRCAQRRPGPRPRQHTRRAAARLSCSARSTKAGASTPATRVDEIAVGHADARSTKAGASTPATHRRGAEQQREVQIAQRRPGPRPRQHRRHLVAEPLHVRRSTKAGASTPATLVAARRVAALPRRSTKAGASTPATPPREHADHLARPRSTKAGASTPATLGALRDDRRQQRRSTKAGASTPATRGPPRSPPGRMPPSLNEGRGLDPGNTRSPAHPALHAPSPLNEGRGLDPGNTMEPAQIVRVLAVAQRRPGPRPRQHG